MMGKSSTGLRTRKSRKGTLQKKWKPKKEYAYLRVILGHIFNRVSERKICSENSRNKRKLPLYLAPTEKENWEEVIEKSIKLSRLYLDSHKEKISLTLKIPP